MIVPGGMVLRSLKVQDTGKCLTLKVGSTVVVTFLLKTPETVVRQKEGDLAVSLSVFVYHILVFVLHCHTKWSR